MTDRFRIIDLAPGQRTMTVRAADLERIEELDPHPDLSRLDPDADPAKSHLVPPTPIISTLYNLFETPTDGNDDGFPPFAGDGLLAEIGLSVRAIRELRGLPPGVGADGRREGKGRFEKVNGRESRETGPFVNPTSATGITRRYVMSFGLNGKGLIASQFPHQVIEVYDD